VAGFAASDSDFDAGGDTVVYRVPVSDAGGYNVLVELNYQPLAYGHLQDLFKSVELKEVDEFKTMFDATELKTETIASATAQVQ
ncbi:MAG: hypothetical protein KDJ38_18340, partial [Gammaproteobacteria bacterium]|nr:hypothetical protein [Gammaproteobacteria bacterium]